MIETSSCLPNSVELILAIQEKCRDMFNSALEQHIAVHGEFVVGFDNGEDVTSRFDTDNDTGRYFNIQGCRKELHDYRHLHGQLAEELGDAFLRKQASVSVHLEIYNEFGDENLSIASADCMPMISIGLKPFLYTDGELAMIHSAVTELWMLVTLRAASD